MLDRVRLAQRERAVGTASGAEVARRAAARNLDAFHRLFFLVDHHAGDPWHPIPRFDHDLDPTFTLAGTEVDRQRFDQALVIDADLVLRSRADAEIGLALGVGLRVRIVRRAPGARCSDLHLAQKVHASACPRHALRIRNATVDRAAAEQRHVAEVAFCPRVQRETVAPDRHRASRLDPQLELMLPWRLELEGEPAVVPGGDLLVLERLTGGASVR
ncbi:MAG TPA: hypothetical protein VK348_01885 [Planctomycetota bacterium]|nr:hypothetical protein [Planctomycetota bacterium]